MTRADVEAAIDATPTGDPAAAIATCARWLDEHGELHQTLTHTLVFRSDRPSETFERILEHRDRWRAARGLPETTVLDLGWNAYE